MWEAPRIWVALRAGCSHRVVWLVESGKVSAVAHVTLSELTPARAI